MLVIRDAQRAAMAPVTDRSFIERLICFLRERRANLVMDFDDDTLRAQVIERLERARRHALTSERALACFVVWSFSYGFRFDEDPLVRSILDDLAVPQSTRIELLARAVTRREWGHVRAAQSASQLPRHVARGADVRAASAR